jgi:hypothetical protein
MKTVLSSFALVLLFGLTSYADDAPTFVKVGSTYVLTGATGVSLPGRVTITAAGGAGWFRVTTPIDAGPNAHPVIGLGDRWINFSQVAEVREVIGKNGPK